MFKDVNCAMEPVVVGYGYAFGGTEGIGNKAREICLAAQILTGKQGKYYNESQVERFCSGILLHSIHYYFLNFSKNAWVDEESHD